MSLQRLIEMSPVTVATTAVNATLSINGIYVYLLQFAALN